MVHSPFPKKLKSEAKKAASILKEFTVPSTKTGPDKIIPPAIFMGCRGVAIITVFRAGFLVGARGGSGLVVAKLDKFSHSWSAPSAVGLVGLGGGFNIGAEVTDFIFILNTQSAVEAFSKGGNLTLGANFSVAAGPLGRNVEGDIAVRSPSAVYSYSKTKGLYAGISLEGAGLIERKETNAKLYGDDYRAADILSGKVEPPIEADPLYNALNAHIELGKKALLKKAKVEARRTMNREAAGGGAIGMLRNMSFRKKKSDKEEARSKATTGSEKKSGRETVKPRSVPRVKSEGKGRGTDSTDWDKLPKCRAVFPYSAQMPCDLSFNMGEVMEILTRTSTQNDWWEGRMESGKVGIFPANYVELI